MKTLFLYLLTFLFSISVMAQNSDISILGNWKGELAVSSTKLPLIFHIKKNANEKGFSATMDSPAQGAKDIPVNEAIFEGNNLTLKLPNLGIEYEGKLISETQIEGTFKQAGQSFPLVLTKIEENTKEKSEEEIQNRPQEPKPPFDYKIEEVKFENKITKEKTILAGTLTLPKNANAKTPVVILISGSGAQDRNQEILGHKPFLVIADYLTKNGVAILRYDDRGTAQSTGTFKNSTSKDFATDVEAAINFLKTRKDIDTKKIGLIGHSEGGIIATMVAADPKNSVAFIVLLAGVAVSGSEVLLTQQAAIGRVNGASEEDIEKVRLSNKAIFDIIKENQDSTILRTKMKNYFENFIVEADFPPTMNKEEVIKDLLKNLDDEWLLFFLRYNPKENLSKVTCPVLAVNGEKDLQVDAKINLTAIENTLKEAGNEKVTIKYFPNLNHLFQTTQLGLPSEYGVLEETFSPLVLEVMKEWIEKEVK
jgi:hypothetical protein